MREPINNASMLSRRRSGTNQPLRIKAMTVFEKPTFNPHTDEFVRSVEEERSAMARTLLYRLNDSLGLTLEHGIIPAQLDVALEKIDSFMFLAGKSNETGLYGDDDLRGCFDAIEDEYKKYRRPHEDAHTDLEESMCVMA